MLLLELFASSWPGLSGSPQESSEANEILKCQQFALSKSVPDTLGNFQKDFERRQTHNFPRIYFVFRLVPHGGKGDEDLSTQAAPAIVRFLRFHPPALLWGKFNVGLRSPSKTCPSTCIQLRKCLPWKGGHSSFFLTALSQDCAAIFRSGKFNYY